MLLNPSVQFFIDARGLLLIERKSTHHTKVYMYLEQYFIFMCQLPLKTCGRYIQNFRKLFTSMNFTFMEKLADQFNAEYYLEMRKIFKKFLWKCQKYNSFSGFPCSYNSSFYSTATDLKHIICLSFLNIYLFFM